MYKAETICDTVEISNDMCLSRRIAVNILYSSALNNTIWANQSCSKLCLRIHSYDMCIMTFTKVHNETYSKRLSDVHQLATLL